MPILCDAMKCSECENMLEKPVILPCGESVCRKHVPVVAPVDGENPKFYCKVCDDSHRVPSDGFPANKALEKFFNMGKEYTEAMKSCRLLDDLLLELSVFTSDPHCFIHDTIDTLRNRVDMKREETKLNIDNQADVMITQLNAYEVDCKNHVDYDGRLQGQLKKLDKSLAGMKHDLEDWLEQLASSGGKSGKLSVLMSGAKQFEKWNKIKVESEKRASLVHKEIGYLKQELMLNKLENFKIIEYDAFKSESKEILGFPSQIEPVQRCFNMSKILDTIEIENSLIGVCNFSKDQEWSLKYQATRDGFSARQFHFRCDGLANTLILIKAASSGFIFGGFTRTMWDRSYESKSDPGAFIFSLVNREQRPTKIRVSSSKEKFAIRCNPNFGPIFGSGIGNDFAICSDSNQVTESFSNLGVCYFHPSFKTGSNEARNFLAGSYRFLVAEIECFQLTSAN